MLIRRLDRYVFGEFWRLFLVTMLGFPVLLIISDLATRLDEYLNRDIPWRDLALSYVYWMPDSAFMVVPAAVLFATVFTISSLTRHAELTAAKASGISFLRMVAPIFVAALLATGLDIGLGMAAPHGNQRRAAVDSRGSRDEWHEPPELRVRERIRARLQGPRAARRLRANSRNPDRAQRLGLDVPHVCHGSRRRDLQRTNRWLASWQRTDAHRSRHRRDDDGQFRWRRATIISGNVRSRC